MKAASHTLVLGAVLATFFSATAMADHNSVHGAGWANMPNDIHNTRIEDDLSNTEFRDFVRQGAGADSVNRYLDTTTSVRGMSDRAASGGGSRR
jgi:hypothetical protein